MRGRGRQQAVLKKLLEVDDFLQAKALAEMLSVSTKTIMRTLADVDEELSLYELRLIRQAGAGYRIEGSETGRRELLADLSEGAAMPLSKEARHRAILAKVLPATEPIKLYSLAVELGVTEGTISTDFDALVSWIEEQGLQLVRRPGLGIYVRGSETNRRRAIVRTIYEGQGSSSLLQLASKGAEDPAGSRAEARFLGLVDPVRLRRLETFVRMCEAELSAPFSDDAFVGLVVHLAIAIERIAKGEDIEIADETLAYLQTHVEYDIAKRLAESLEGAFDIAIGESEIGYITMHLLGARSRYSLTEGGHTLDNFRLVQFARQLMKRAGELTGTPLLKDAALLQGLVNHLGPSISRLELALDIRNPLQGEMERVYPELMKLAKESVVPLEESLGRAFPPAEIAYIAMHLGAALKSHGQRDGEKRRVAVSCPTGMGTSRLLASRLQETYKELEVVAEAAVLDLTDDYLDALEVDFLISMVPLEHVTYPFVVVSPLLTAEDRARIDACLALLPLHERRAQGEGAAGKESDAAREKARPTVASLAEAGRIASLAADVAGRFFLQTIEVGAGEDVCTLAARAACEARRTGGADIRIVARIADALRRREERAPTLTPDGRLRILHAKADGAPYAVGVLREETQGTVDLVLLAPPAASEAELALLGAVPAASGTEETFFSALQEGGYEEVRSHIVRVFHDFLQEKYFS